MVARLDSRRVGETASTQFEVALRSTLQEKFSYTLAVVNRAKLLFWAKKKKKLKRSGVTFFSCTRSMAGPNIHSHTHT